MNNKSLALVSYITIIGWLISFFSYKDKEKNSLVSYHLRQSLGLFLSALAYNIVTSILIRILLAKINLDMAIIFSCIVGLGGLVIFVLFVFGIINANKEEEKPLPLIGKYFEGKFNFIP